MNNHFNYKSKNPKIVSVSENIETGKIAVDIIENGGLTTIYIEGKIVNPWKQIKRDANSPQ